MELPRRRKSRCAAYAAWSGTAASSSFTECSRGSSLWCSNKPLADLCGIHSTLGVVKLTPPTRRIAPPSHSGSERNARAKFCTRLRSRSRASTS
eukprot:1230173-Prymnesium_polylepis.1